MMYSKIGKVVLNSKIDFMKMKIFDVRISNFIGTNTSWMKPGGYNTGINIYNCVARDKVPLISKQKGIITWYTCGPTVYDEAHIGHAICYLKIDILQRILFKYFNLIIVAAMNITDIDDKIIRRGHELNKPFRDISGFYESRFWDDLANIKIKKPDLVLRVSENIPYIKDFIHVLMNKGLAYESIDGSVYFKIKDNFNYGKLVKIAKNDNTEKTQEISDCVVWKASTSSEPFWDSPWGNGRPGWHIECSALASKLFGSSLDIHAGGMDLKFPHHENEEAQSCAYHSSPQWVNYWVHIGQLHLKSSEKMSKSLKNTISISSALKSFGSDVLRFACIMSHYRSRMEYSEELMKMSRKTLKRYRNFLSNCDIYILRNIKPVTDEESIKYLLMESKELVHNAFCDDFNTPEVIRVLNKLVNTTNALLSSNNISISTVVGLKNFVCHILNVFNVSTLEEVNIRSASENSEIADILVDFRKAIREIGLASKDQEILEICDKVRSRLRNKGIEIKDLNENGYSVSFN